MYAESMLFTLPRIWDVLTTTDVTQFRQRVYFNDILHENWKKGILNINNTIWKGRIWLKKQWKRICQKSIQQEYNWFNKADTETVNNPNAKCSLEFHSIMYFFLCNLVGNSNKKPGLLYFWIKSADSDKAKCTTPAMLEPGTGLKSTFQAAVNATRLDFGKEFLWQA